MSTVYKFKFGRNATFMHTMIIEIKLIIRAIKRINKDFYMLHIVLILVLIIVLFFHVSCSNVTIK